MFLVIPLGDLSVGKVLRTCEKTVVDVVGVANWYWWEEAGGGEPP